MMKIRFLKANEGDCILLSFKEGYIYRNIMIDGGVPKTYMDPSTLKGELKTLIGELKIKNEKIDLLVISHVDSDHIGGIWKWLEKDIFAFEMIGKVWFNSGKLIAEYLNAEPKTEHDLFLEININNQVSIGQGKSVEKYLLDHNIWDRQIIHNQLKDNNIFGLKLTILSPNELALKALYNKWEKEYPTNLVAAKANDYHLSINEHIAADKFEEDTATHNGSSIAFILEFDGKKFLFLADAHPNIIIEKLKLMGYSEQNPLSVEMTKISHHGSKANTNFELLKMINCNNFVISTNGNVNNHPHKQMLARLIKTNPDCTIYFNYAEQIPNIFSVNDIQAFPNIKLRPLINNELTY